MTLTTKGKLQDAHIIQYYWKWLGFDKDKTEKWEKLFG